LKRCWSGRARDGLAQRRISVECVKKRQARFGEAFGLYQVTVFRR